MSTPSEPIGQFVRALRPKQRGTYARAVRAELTNAYQQGFISKNAVPSVRMVGDALGVLSGKKLKGLPGYSASGTPQQIPPSPPFSSEQWMKAAASAAWQKFPERAASVGLNPPPYPTASAQISGQVPPSEPTHDESVVGAQRVLQYLLARFNPIRGMTPERLGTYLEQWELGFLRWLALTWNQVRLRDDQIKAVEAKRIFAVSRLKWEIITDDETPEAEQHKQALEAAYRGVTSTDALDQNKQGGVSMLIRQMMECIGSKFAVHEIVWKPDVDIDGIPSLTAHFRHIPLWFFENRTGQLRYLPYELALDGIPLDAGGWLIATGDGLNFSTCIAWIYKQLGLKAWANFVDKYGMPFIHGKTTASFGSNEWNDFVSSVAAIRSDGSLVTNPQAALEVLKVEGATGNPQELFCDRMDRAIARLWRGGDLSTMSRSGSGASGALPQLNQEDELAEADSILLSEALNFYFDRWVIRYQFGAPAPKARFKIIPPKNTDTAKEIAVDQFLMSVGVPMAIADLQNRYGRPAPDEGEKLAVAAAPAGGAAGAGIGKGIGDEPATGPLSLGNIAVQVAAFKAEAMKRMSLAQAKALAPLADRIKSAAAIDNDEQRQAAMAEIKKDLPKIFRRVNDGSGELIKRFEEILSSALVSGAVESASSR